MPEEAYQPDFQASFASALQAVLNDDEQRKEYSVQVVNDQNEVSEYFSLPNYIENGYNNDSNNVPIPKNINGYWDLTGFCWTDISGIHFITSLKNNVNVNTITQSDVGVLLCDNTFDDCTLQNWLCPFTDLTRATFITASIQRSSFSGAIVDHGDFKDAILGKSDDNSGKVLLADGVSFQGASLTHVRWRKASIFGCDFSRSFWSTPDTPDTAVNAYIVNGCDFEAAEMTGVRFGTYEFESIIVACRFNHAKLNNAFFLNAILIACSFQFAHANDLMFVFIGSFNLDFNAADFTSSHFLTPTRINALELPADSGNILPEHLKALARDTQASVRYYSDLFPPVPDYIDTDKHHEAALKISQELELSNPAAIVPLYVGGLDLTNAVWQLGCEYLTFSDPDEITKAFTTGGANVTGMTFVSDQAMSDTLPVELPSKIDEKENDVGNTRRCCGYGIVTALGSGVSFFAAQASTALDTALGAVEGVILGFGQAEKAWQESVVNGSETKTTEKAAPLLTP